MIVILNRFIWKFDIGIGKYSNFESRHSQPISARIPDWGLLRLPQSEASD